MKREIIPEIYDFKDLFKKLDYDIVRFGKNNHIYELIDCLMTLNALPEWIKKSDTSSEELKLLAIQKEKIMKGENGFQLDVNLIDSDINHQLRLIRLFCNHSKHKTDSGQIPIIYSEYGATLPMTLPAKLFNIIAIGNMGFDVEFLIHSVTDFWKKEMSRC
jgi:hypothetical protein